MTQANRTLALLAGLTAAAIAIGLYAYYGVQKPDERDARAKDRNERLFDPLKLDEKTPDGGLPRTEFVKIVVASGAETTTLEREPGKEWRITAPVKSGADKLAIDQVVSQLQAAKFKQVIDEKPDQTALLKYGLSPPQFIVTAEVLVGEKAEKRTLRLEGGIENTFDGTVYLRRDGDPQVWSAEGGVRWSLQKSTFDLREKEAFGMPEPKIVKVEVKTKDNQYTIARDAQKLWRLVKPIDFAADQATIVTALGTLNQLKAISFPADTPELRKSFEAPGSDATFTLEGGATVRVRLTKAGTQVMMLREEGGAALLAELGGNAIGQLDRNPNDLKDRLVLTFKKNEVAKIVLHQADGSQVVVERPMGADGGSGEAWKVTAPQAGPARTFKIASVLWTLGALKAASVVEPAPAEPSNVGIDDKGRWVGLYGPDGKELARLWIGKDVPGKPNTSYLRGSRNQVVEADNSRLADLPFKVGDVLEGADAG